MFGGCPPDGLWLWHGIPMPYSTLHASLKKTRRAARFTVKQSCAIVLKAVAGITSLNLTVNCLLRTSFERRRRRRSGGTGCVHLNIFELHVKINAYDVINLCGFFPSSQKRQNGNILWI